MSDIYHSPDNGNSNKYECTINQKLTDSAAQAPSDATYSLARWQHFVAWNNVTSLPPSPPYRKWRQIENLIPLIDTHLLEEHSCQISSRSDLKRGALGFLRRSPQQEEEKQEQNE